MDLSQILLEVQVLVLLLGGDADITAGGQAPVAGLYLMDARQLHPPLHITELGLREALGEPAALLLKVPHLH